MPQRQHFKTQGTNLASRDLNPKVCRDTAVPKDVGDTSVQVSPGCGQTRLRPQHPPQLSPRRRIPSAAAVTLCPAPGPARPPHLPASIEGHVLPKGPLQTSAGAGHSRPQPCPTPLPTLRYLSGSTEGHLLDSRPGGQSRPQGGRATDHVD